MLPTARRKRKMRESEIADIGDQPPEPVAEPRAAQGTAIGLRGVGVVASVSGLSGLDGPTAMELIVRETTPPLTGQTRSP
ncbi:MAG: hypothetical protein IT293_08400 [Deltaproteobacteria bacterium]|nr:hypothetical protein [Deltaproteobacteria bacterium]